MHVMSFLKLLGCLQEKVQRSVDENKLLAIGCINNSSVCICTCICGWTIGNIYYADSDVLFRDGCWDYYYNYFEIGEEMAGAVLHSGWRWECLLALKLGKDRTRELYYVFNSQVHGV